MTITVSLATITESISNLDIQGVTVKDIDSIPDSAKLLCPLLIPNPTRFITNISTSRESTGGGGSALMNMDYTLNYIYLHCQAPGGISNFSNYAGLVDNLVHIIEAILENDDIAGAVDMTFGDIDRIDTIQDPAGNEFLGVMFSVRIKEFTQ